MKLNKNFQRELKIPFNIKIQKHANFLFFFGPLGSTVLDLKKLDPKGLGAVSFLEKQRTFIVSSYCKDFLGSIFSLVKNQINGVTRGFLVYLRILGVGYRAQLENQTLVFKLGFSHDLKYQLPPSVRVFLLEPTLLCLYGIEKNQVTQTAAKIRQLKAPSVYKGKGIRFSNETVILKLGKRK